MANVPQQTATAASGAAPAVSRLSAMQEDYGVLIGWSHAPIGRDIRLVLQSATTDQGRRSGDIAARSYLMTRNQALILARYLLDVTGQTLPPPRRMGRIKRLWRRLVGG